MLPALRKNKSILLKVELSYNDALFIDTQSVKMAKYVCKLRPGFLLFCLFFIVLFCVLGVWQLHRYHYKNNLLATYQHRQTMTPVPFQQLIKSTDDLQFQSVKVQGRYKNELTMLMQNRLNKGKVGFEVLTPLQIQGDKKLLLVNRGWVPTPTFSPVDGEQNITGYIKLLNEYQFTLGSNIANPKATPIVMQRIDVDELSQITHESYYPFILRLGATEPNGYVRNWIITAGIPQRHMAYAVQWFAMAFVLLIAYLCFCCERINKKENL